jgi:hypothetical protein
VKSFLENTNNAACKLEFREEITPHLPKCACVVSSWVQALTQDQLSDLWSALRRYPISLLQYEWKIAPWLTISELLHNVLMNSIAEILDGAATAAQHDGCGVIWSLPTGFGVSKFST